MSDYISSNEDTNTTNNNGDEEWRNDESVKITHNLNQYSLKYIKVVVAFGDEKDANGKRRHTWKSIQNRFKSLLNQSYVSLFRNYLQK